MTGRLSALLAAGAQPLSPGQVLTALGAWAAVAGYLAAAGRLRRRGDRWPWRRDLSFTAGGLALGAAATAPLPGGPFTAHMAQHLVTGMAAPLLLVLARPVTLALRALPPGSARRGLLAIARSRPAAWLVFPPLAALLDLGGLWVLYRTDLFAASHHQPLLHSLVHLHVVAAGLLFSFAVCAPDPLRHRWGLAWRGTTLLIAGTAHAVLAKSLYAAPPPGTAFGTADLRTGARLMYYGGDLVELALAAALAAQWYAATGRARARAVRRAGAGATAGAGARYGTEPRTGLRRLAAARWPDSATTPVTSLFGRGAAGRWHAGPPPG